MGTMKKLARKLIVLKDQRQNGCGTTTW